MQYFLTAAQLERIEKGLKAAIAIPFIDDIEDYIVEAILEYTKEIDGIDPFTNIRSKRLYDVVDTETRTGYSVKSLKWAFRADKESEFELVIQRADIFKKATALGFDHLDINSDPQTLGAALLEHWRIKVEDDATFQNVDSKRIFVLLKSIDNKNFAFLRKTLNCITPMKSLGVGLMTQKLVSKVFAMKTRCVSTDGILIKSNFLSVSNFPLIPRK